MNRTFLRLIKIAGSYKLWMLLAAFVGFLTIGSSIGLMMTSAYIIAKAALHPSIAELQVGIVGVRFFGISRGVFRYIERFISHEITFKLLAKFRVWFFESIEPLFPSKLAKFKSGDLLTRAVSDVENLEHIYVRVIAPPFVAILVLILVTFLFGSFNLIYAVIVLIFFILAGIGVPALTYLMSKNTGRKLVTLKSKLNELIIDQTQGMQELIIFGQRENYLRNFKETNYEYISLQKKMANISGLNDSLIGLFMNFAVFFILLNAIPNINNGILDGVYLSVLALGTMACFEAVLPLPTAIQYWEQSINSANRLFELTDEKQSEIKEIELTPQPENFDIDIRNINFGYNNDTKVYNKLSLYIPENEVTAIVGASGAGKSTLVNLLMRFWDYESGKFLLGNEELKNFTQEEIQKYISVVPQTTHLFNLPVKENIRFSKPDASENEIIYAAKKANIHNFIMSLPNKYDEWIGEQGLKLSGGERQRISIARALLKDTPVIVFDEPTADLDSLNEKKILELIYELSESKTVLLITHRLVHLENINQILVMHGGKIIERGMFDELLAKKGYFYKMFNLQNNLVV